MKKYILIALLFPLILTGCIHDCITDPEEGVTTITITADLPGDSASTSGKSANTSRNEPSASGNNINIPNTRIALTQDGLDVKLTWETGDKIYFVFAEGGSAKGKQTVTLATEDITNEGKKASFAISIPATITAETFELYGVYGVTGYAGEESYELTLPTTPWSGTLTHVQDKDVVMLRFAETGINRASPTISVTFEHVGSLFRIVLKNTSGSTLEDIKKAELISASAIQAQQNSGGATFNAVTGAFSGTTATGTSLPFEITETSLAAAGTLEFWGWFPPVADQNWPWLGLIVTYGETNTVASVNYKTTRETATATGKAFHFYASYDGTYLKFTNSAGDADENKFTDSRDGNEYKTVLIGTQIWMAENLKYLPSVVGPASGSDSEAFHYVYGYDGTDVAVAKASANYQTYGVLYNWTAAMAGAATSSSNPSGVQGACPTGWHLPSDAEWQQLEMYLGMAEATANTTGWRSTADEANKLKEAGVAHWYNLDGHAGVTNSSGFTALPGGYRADGGTFSVLTYYGHWWTSTHGGDAISSWCRYMNYTYSTVCREGLYRRNGYSVRCVKD